MPKTEASHADMNYDPNLITNGKNTTQVVRITLGMWNWRETFDVPAGGNVMGFMIIESAIESLYEKLFTIFKANNDGVAKVVFKRGIETFTCVDDNGDGSDWLKSMVVAAEIVSIEPNGRLW
jgi:hypothetical protein